MKDFLIVGLRGKARAGKDTTFSLVKPELEQLGYIVHQVPFAKGVKDFGEQYFGKLVDLETKDATTRLVLQGIGHMIREEVGEQFWVERAFKTIAKLRERDEKYGKKSIFFITDVRYPNEVISIEDSGGLVISVNRNQVFLEGDAANHPSETALDNWVFKNEILNEGTLEDLKKKAMKIILEAIDERNSN